MNIFIDAWLNHESPVIPFSLNLLKTLLYRVEFFVGKDARLVVRSSPGDRSGDVLGVESSVVIDRLVVLGEQRILGAFESGSAPFTSNMMTQINACL